MNLKRGYSLIEALVYAALAVLILGAIISSILIFNTTLRTVKVVRDLDNSSYISMDRMTREIRNSESLDNAASIYNATSGVLTLNTTDQANSPIKIKFYLSNGILMMDRANSPIGPLSLSSVRVNSLIFRPIISTSSQAVKIEMEIQATSTNFNSSKKFYNTIILNGSYI
jgi:Tfp pilus assembly protein PilW